MKKEGPANPREKMFKRVQYRFVLIPVLVSMCLLACVFGTVFFISNSASERSAKMSIDLTLGRDVDASFLPGPVDELRCMKVLFLEDKREATLFKFDLYDESAARNIVFNAIQAMDSGKNEFSAQDRTFKVDRVSTVNEEGEALTVYAIYDYTSAQSSVATLGTTLICIYFLTVAVIAVISYILSSSAVAPIRDAFRKQQELIANASHELKTPLTIVATNLDLVASDPSAAVADNRKWLDSAVYQLQRMNNLILQMLELSAIEAGNRRYDAENVDLSDLCQGILLSFEASNYEKGLITENRVQEGVFYFCDRSEVEKLITILVDNANKYTPAGGVITFTLTGGNKGVKIIVKNTGAGMDQEQTKNVFERFYKADAAHREDGTSFGLGLSIAKSIANTEGGDIVCTSEKDQWTCFEVTLPARGRNRAKADADPAIGG